MSRRKKEDHHLWEKVKASVKPLDKNRATFSELLEQDVSSLPTFNRPVILPKKGKSISRPAVAQPVSLVPRPKVLDPAISKKIARGRIEIEGKIDLHGLKQVEAHQRLWRFVETAFHSGKRTVLVITGKGVGGEGILRRAVPIWLQEKEFAKFSSGYQEAHVRHGGSGALYVRIRQNRKGNLG